jgi:hypothetical protein
LLFKSFTGLTVEEFDNIYDREITKRYGKYEIQRLSQRKESRKRSYGAEEDLSNWMLKTDF